METITRLAGTTLLTPQFESAKESADRSAARSEWPVKGLLATPPDIVTEDFLSLREQIDGPEPSTYHPATSLSAVDNAGDLKDDVRFLVYEAGMSARSAKAFKETVVNEAYGPGVRRIVEASNDVVV